MCKPIEKTFRKTARVTAHNPHGLACAVARIHVRKKAAALHEDLWEAARLWRQQTECPPPCVKTGSGQISSSDPHIRCYEDNLGKSCTCIADVSVRAFITCTNEEHAALLEESEIEVEELPG